MTKAKTFIGKPRSHKDDNKFWIIENAQGEKAFLPRSTLIHSGFNPGQLSKKPELKMLTKENGEKGERAISVSTLNGKGAPEKKRAKKQVKQPKRPDMQPGQPGKGTIKTLNKNKGFGFIRVQGFSDLFFHASDCEVEFSTLFEGLKVVFIAEGGKKGSKARVFDAFLESEDAAA